jgi:hypothetical protein
VVSSTSTLCPRTMCQRLHVAVLFGCPERAGRHGIRLDLRLTVGRPETGRTLYSISKPLLRREIVLIVGAVLIMTAVVF